MNLFPAFHMFYLLVWRWPCGTDVSAVSTFSNLKMPWQQLDEEPVFFHSTGERFRKIWVIGSERKRSNKIWHVLSWWNMIINPDIMPYMSMSTISIYGVWCKKHFFRFSQQRDARWFPHISFPPYPKILFDQGYTSWESSQIVVCWHVGFHQWLHDLFPSPIFSNAVWL